MSDPSSIVAVILSGLGAAFMLVWLVRNFRSLMAILTGTALCLVLATVSGVVIGFCFEMVYRMLGVPENEIFSRVHHSLVYWLACAVIGSALNCFAGFVAGTVAGRDEMVHAFFVALVWAGLGLTHRLQPASESAGWLWWAGVVVGVPLTIWGGQMAARSKQAADNAHKHAGPRKATGPERV